MSIVRFVAGAATVVAMVVLLFWGCDQACVGVGLCSGPMHTDAGGWLVPGPSPATR